VELVEMEMVVLLQVVEVEQVLLVKILQVLHLVAEEQVLPIQFQDHL
jgi:hypothetical protein